MKIDLKKSLLSVGLFFILCTINYGQNQAVADSLEKVYLQGDYPAETKLVILKELAANHTNPENKLTYSDALLASSMEMDSISFVVIGFIERGNALRLSSDLSQSLESYFAGATIASEQGLLRNLGICNIAIADVYSIMGNHNNAVSYYHRAMAILREENDSVNLASALLNTGDEYFNYGKLDSALIYFKESGEIFEAINYEMGVAYNLGNVGLVYAEQGKDVLAENNVNQAIAYLEKLQDYYPISIYLIYMSDVYLRRKDLNTAIGYASRSLDLAQKYGMKEQVSQANLKLSEIYESIDNYQKSLNYYQQYIIFRDSVSNIETVQQMANLRTNFEVSQKQMEVDLLNLQKRNQKIIVFATGLALFLSALLALGLFRRYQHIRKTNSLIDREKNRSENLLLNILPAETAQELKEFGRVKAHRFESVTVLFTDFVGFTNYAENLTPEILVENVDFYFSKFDAIIEKYGLEKIKTVGDSYMCAGGLPYPTKDHAYKMVSAACEIAAFVVSVKKSGGNGRTPFDIRIGINSGPVVAGVVGTKKFAYDIWGDTVNIASRIESRSEPGKINISENTFQKVRDKFKCTYRGEIEVKNKGLMKMYFVNESNEESIVAGSSQIIQIG